MFILCSAAPPERGVARVVPVGTAVSAQVRQELTGLRVTAAILALGHVLGGYGHARGHELRKDALLEIVGDAWAHERHSQFA